MHGPLSASTLPNLHFVRMGAAIEACNLPPWCVRTDVSNLLVGHDHVSEQLQPLVLLTIPDVPHQPTPDQVADAFEAMIADLKSLMAKHTVTEPAYLNMVYTDGRIAVGLRYVSDRSEALTLYYSEGKKYECNGNVCRMVRGADKREHAAMIVSEKLTDVADDFIEVPTHQ